MKKTIRVTAFIILITVCLVLNACGESIKLEYYSNTEIPTFTCVTGVSYSEKDNSNTKLPIYTYHCSDDKAEQYIDYLQDEQGYAIVESDDGYSFITLAKGDWGVIVDSQGESIRVLPYKRNT